MAEVNQCDLFCPRKALMAAEYREDSADAGAFKKLSLATALGVCGVQQMARAASCPVRNDPAENWQPREECVDAVRASMAERPLNQAALTEYERGVLGPIIDLDPPAIEG